MKLFINAINLSSAGGLNVTLNLLKGFVEHRPDTMHLYVAAPRHCGYEALAGPFLELIWVPGWATNWVARFYVDYVWVPHLIRKISPDLVFTMGNFATPTPVRQVLLLHYPHPAYPDETEVWHRLRGFDWLNVRVRNAVFDRRLPYTDTLLVQTRTMQTRIRRQYPAVSVVELLPNAYTQLTGQAMYQLPFVREPGHRYLLCLSRYYPHKNLEILVGVAHLIQQRNLPYRILLTIEPGQHRNARRLLAQINQQNLQSVLINLGAVSGNHVASLHGQVDGVLLPTLLESFTAIYADALHFGVPIFTSRRDFSVEICGNCAWYFDPLSARSIVDSLEVGFNNSGLLAQKIADGRARSARMPNWSMVAQSGLAILDHTLNGPPGQRQATASGAIAFHDHIADHFARRYETSAAFGERFRVWTQLFDRYVASTSRVLDLGCGSGVFSTYLAEAGCSVTAIDGSAAMIALGRQQRTAGLVQYEQQSLPLANPGPYAGQDVVIASSLLEYMDDGPRLLEQIAMLLRPNGLLIASIPNRLSLYRRLERLVFACTGRPRYFAHIRYVSTAADFRAQLNQLGFDTLETVYFSSHDPLSRFFKRLLPRPYVNNLVVGVFRKR